MAELGRSADLQREALALDADLRAGRWQLDRAAFYYFSGQAHGWLGSTEDPQPVPEALAGAVEILWNKWRQTPRNESNPTGRQCLSSEGIALLAIWQSSPEGLVALVVGPGYQARHFFPGDSKYVLFFRRDSSDSAWAPWRVPVSGGEPEKMGLEKECGTISVHPNGRLLAFSVNEEPANEVWVMENFLPLLKPAR